MIKKVYHHHHEISDHLSERERTLIKLQYLIEHNQSHTQEVKELAECFEGTQKERILDAVLAYQKADELLKKALED